MRREILLNKQWTFQYHDGKKLEIDLPHTWNNLDGQDGGDDYWRGTCTYQKGFPMLRLGEDECVYLEFEGINASARVSLNGTLVAVHDGGYSTFRCEITGLLKENNELTIEVDNSKNDRVYPQKADFTFYGGIYRDVRLVIVPKSHFDLDYLGSCGVRVTATPDGSNAFVRIKSRVTGGQVEITLLDREGRTVAMGQGTDTTLTIVDAHRWHGVEDPYLYTARCRVTENGSIQDSLDIPFGVRSFRVDSKQGFILNDKPYPLHGVSRHQDRKGLGNAITKEMHEEDMALIAELGANTVRLAHYQHDQYFYDLCDQYGMVVWAEIPYISEHMPNGRENTISQMKELIEQNYNHPCIVCWGVSNEITISTKDKKDMLENHHVLNDLCHELDPTRFTTLACYAMCGPFNKVAHITDVVSWNLYLGWYMPGCFLNDLWIGFWHLCYPNRPLGYSEYGAEGMPNLHSEHPRRNDHTEEYQAKYHEFMLRCFCRHPYMWSTHVWNMFDFAADARDQGGEPGMNHKGLVTFDRKTKKDSFYLYKAWWSKDPFVHICSKRFTDRAKDTITVKVYSNQPTVTLKVNGREIGSATEPDHVFIFRVKVEKNTKVEAVAGSLKDSAVFHKVDVPNPDYVLKKSKNQQASNWVDA